MGGKEVTSISGSISGALASDSNLCRFFARFNAVLPSLHPYNWASIPHPQAYFASLPISRRCGLGKSGALDRLPSLTVGRKAGCGLFTGRCGFGGR